MTKSTRVSSCGWLACVHHTKANERSDCSKAHQQTQSNNSSNSGEMLPQRVARAPSPHARASPPWPRIALYALALFSSIYALRFVYSKCDTRAHMSVLLTKTTAILKANDVEYWLDKGTLLGVHRDAGLIPWEYDVDLGVMNATCSEISALKSAFASVGLVAYDRSDYIPHKVKITYDTENHHFYWSDPYMHDPCIRVYDMNDVSTWVDIYWYVEVRAAEVAAKRSDILVPPGYDGNSSLLCCSEGLQEFTDHMCCGGCVPYASVFPLKKQRVFVPDGVYMTQEQFVPHAVPEFLKIQYGRNALESREIKVRVCICLTVAVCVCGGGAVVPAGMQASMRTDLEAVVGVGVNVLAQGWKGIVCGFWTNPLLFAVHLATFVGLVLLLALWFRRRRAAARHLKPRSL